MTTEQPTKKAKLDDKCEVCRHYHAPKATTSCDECKKKLCDGCATTCAGGYIETNTFSGGERVTVEECSVTWCPVHAARVAQRCYRKIPLQQSPPNSPMRWSEFHPANAVFCSSHITKCNLCPVASCEYHAKRDRDDDDKAEAQMHTCERCTESVCAHDSVQCGCERNECRKCWNPKYQSTSVDYMCKWCRDDNRRGACVDGDTSDEENGRLDKDGKYKKPANDDDDGS